VCGLAALVTPDDAPDPADAPAVTDALRRRGPDGHGGWSGAHASLWSTRLALWDEGRTTQPYAADGLAAAFNGELFNLPHLQRRLGMPGAAEIEVLAHGVARLGPDFLREIDGQFAVVVVDERTGRTVAGRDRMGICPLYTAPVRTPAGRAGTAYASEPGALRVLAPETFDWSPEGVADLLVDWAVPAPRTTWAGVAQVPSGTAVAPASGGPGAGVGWARPWGPPDASRPAAPWDPDDPAAVDEVEALLRDAVHTRARSVGEVAVAVSGGVDSSTIAAIGAQEGLRRSFGIVVEGDEPTAARQRAVAQAVGLHHEVLELGAAAAWTAFQRVVTSRGIPLARLGPVGMAELARLVRSRGVTSVLSGEGADELFGGYDSARVLAARAGAWGATEDLDWRGFGAAELRQDAGPTWHAAYWRTVVADPTGALDRGRILGPVRSLFGPDLAEAWDRRALGAGDGRTPAGTADPDARRVEDLTRLLAPFLLTVQGDHAWMGEGVEQRPPWLAGPVVDWAMARPVAGFLTLGAGKTPVRALLRRLATAYPGLAALDVPKAAYRIDASLFLRDAAAWEAMCAAIRRCPPALVDVDALLARARACHRAGRVSEPESALLLVASSLGLLAGAR